MPYRIFTIPFDADKEIFGDEELNTFLPEYWEEELEATQPLNRLV